jgi:hypothetical protein
MSEQNARLWSALADLMKQYDAQRRIADNQRRIAECDQDLERLRKWMAVEMDAQKSLRTLAEVVQMLLASEGLVALSQELNPPTKSLSRFRNWSASVKPACSEKEEGPPVKTP